MKPEELFIGALARTPLGEKGWVRSIHYVTKEDGHGGYYLITLAFDKDGESYTKICEKDVKPIPITPEILEKNGWERVLTEENGLFTLYALPIKTSKSDRDHTQVVIYFYDEEIFEVKTLVKIQCNSSNKGVNSVHSCDCEYIHQLQMAMKLCKIEKEIEL